MRGVSVSGEWFHNDAKNSWERNNVLRPGTYSNGAVSNASYRPVTVFSPIDGTPITVYDTVSAAVAAAVKNVDTNDSNVKQSYNALRVQLPGAAAARRAAVRRIGDRSHDRQHLQRRGDRTRTSWSTIGGVNYCDQTNSGIPWRTQFKLAGTFPLPWYGMHVRGVVPGAAGLHLGTSALTAGGAGAPNFTLVQRRRLVLRP